MKKRELYSITNAIHNLCQTDIAYCSPVDDTDVCHLVNTVEPRGFNFATLEISHPVLSDSDRLSGITSHPHDTTPYFYYTHDRRLMPKIHEESLFECVVKIPQDSIFLELREVFIGNHNELLNKVVDHLSSLSIQQPVSDTKVLNAIFQQWALLHKEEEGKLILIGGDEGTGRTTIAQMYIDYIIANQTYCSDNVIIIEDKTDFDVLLDKISANKIHSKSLILFDEFHAAGDMFAVSSLLEAGCDVMVVVRATSFCDMSDALFLTVSTRNSVATIKEINKHLCHKLITLSEETTDGNTYKYSSYSLNNK